MFCVTALNAITWYIHVINHIQVHFQNALISIFMHLVIDRFEYRITSYHLNNTKHNQNKNTAAHHITSHIAIYGAIMKLKTDAMLVMSSFVLVFYIY
jgi:hypothetical protein